MLPVVLELQVDQGVQKQWILEFQDALKDQVAQMIPVVQCRQEVLTVPMAQVVQMDQPVLAGLVDPADLEALVVLAVLCHLMVPVIPLGQEVLNILEDQAVQVDYQADLDYQEGQMTQVVLDNQSALEVLGVLVLRLGLKGLVDQKGPVDQCLQDCLMFLNLQWVL